MINIESLLTEELQNIGKELNTFAEKQNLEFYRVGFGNMDAYLMTIPKSMIKEDTIQEGTLANPHRINPDLRFYLINQLTVPRYTHTKEMQIPQEIKNKYPSVYKSLIRGVRISNNEIELIRRGLIQPLEKFEYLKEEEKLDPLKFPLLLVGNPIILKKTPNLD